MRTEYAFIHGSEYYRPAKRAFRVSSSKFLSYHRVITPQKKMVLVDSFAQSCNRLGLILGIVCAKKRTEPTWTPGVLSSAVLS